MPTSYKTVLTVATYGVVLLSTPLVAGHFIEKATRTQCLTHDWPTHLHQNHLDFCKEFGYPTKS
jgi:hypothetical protein